MPIYKFACYICGHELEKIVKINEKVFCTKCAVGPLEQEMEKVLSVPSPFQWGCVKGF